MSYFTAKMHKFDFGWGSAPDPAYFKKGEGNGWEGKNGWKGRGGDGTGGEGREGREGKEEEGREGKEKEGSQSHPL